ncbi:uncharacterized protein cyst isoform X2 [Lepeophtheirus salmonis]|uniref:uncharacterized protein cyst isoform X2 n=1 Tax=Lepeophtheirus salmonis TaxID=72036 RepID=UPI001AEA9456|nr:rho guanine nucleotide exchange factor 18-like isoform X2 [Lepeophtheirus salmonis]
MNKYGLHCHGSSKMIMVSSDEAPDTGEESEEDLITSYLGHESACVLASQQAHNHNRILEENLLQLSEIHENIQRMRMENAEASGKLLLGPRISSSCPSLNNEEEEEIIPERNETDKRLPSSVTTPPSSSSSASVPPPNHTNNTTNSHSTTIGALTRSRRKGGSSNGVTGGSSGDKRKHRSGRRRSLSVSSGDSEGDTVDGIKGAPRPRSSSSIVFARSTSGAPDSASPTFVKPESGKGGHGRARKGSHLFSHLPALQKSISTPSIAVDQTRNGKNKWASRRFVASDSESEEDYNLVQHNSSSAKVAGSNHHPHQQHLHRTIPGGGEGAPPLPPNQNNSSPQLSLTEFLHLPDPVLEDNDDQRKRRRKKERSSIFFRKKKDKNSSSSKSFQQPFSKIQSVSAMNSFSKIGNINHHPPHYIQMINNRIPSHSHSMSSLRKSSAGSYTSNFYTGRGDSGKYDDKDETINLDDTTGLLECEFTPNEEIFIEGGPAGIRSLDTDPFLKIEEDEPENWQQTRRPADIQDFRPIDIKRQEHIYEFIITESNHCQVLKVIQKIFVEGMTKYLNLSSDIIDRLFPSLDLLIDIHFKFLEELRVRQNQEPIVDTIDDILLSQFSGPNAELWRRAYGIFCSHHTDAVSTYKDIMKSDRRFQQFVRQCTANPLLKKKGIPECILFVTTRITKYPLLIEPLIKTAKDRPEEQKKLIRINDLVRGILNDVNSKVAEKEREQRLIEIYNRIDTKSSLLHQGKKFKKSDMLSSSRRLMFEGIGSLQQSRNRNLQVNIVVLSDILLFFQDNNQKFVFVTPDNKPAIVPVRTLIAREKTGLNTKALYLISTSETEPEMYQIDIQQPPTREEWIRGIREAVDACSPGSDSDSHAGVCDDDLRKYVEAKYLRMRHLMTELRSKDLEVARLLEDKMRVMADAFRAIGNNNVIDDEKVPDYVSLVQEKDSSSGATKAQLLEHLQEVHKISNQLYGLSNSSVCLSRSVSSVGEQKSNTYTCPVLPKRAETFGGFDQQAGSIPTIQEVGNSAETITDGNIPKSNENVLIQLDPEQQKAAVRMNHHLNSLICLISEHFTSLESLKSDLNEARDRVHLSGGRYKHNQQLEELRNLQEQLTHEKLEWQREVSSKEQDLDDKKDKLNKAQVELEREKKDVAEQRDQLYRKLEALKAQGIDFSSNMTILKSDHSNDNIHSASGYVMNLKVHDANSSPPVISYNSTNSEDSVGVNQSPSDLVAPRLPNSSSSLGSAHSLSNLNLLSTTNESNRALKDNLEIKQQIPVKLSSKLSTSISKEKSKKSSFISSGGKQSGKSGNSLDSSGIHQLLPLKLVESQDKKGSFKCNNSCSSYQKLSDSHLTSAGSGDHEIFHTRSGSSPVSMSQPSSSRKTAEEKVVFL